MKHSVALVLTLASGLALTAAAQTPSAPDAAAAPAATAPAGPAKIAVVAFQVAVAQTNEGQRSFADLQRKYQPKQTQLKALNDEIDTLTKQLQASGDKLSDDERAARAKTIDDKKKQLERSAEDAQNDMQNEMQELYSSLASKVYDVLNDYAKTARLHARSRLWRSSRAPCSTPPNRPTSPRPSLTPITLSRACLPQWRLQRATTPVPSAPKPAAPRPTTPQ